MKRWIPCGLILAGAATLALSTTPAAATSVELAVLPHELTLDPGGVYDALRLTVGGPDGTVRERRGEAATFLGLSDRKGEPLPDGLYAYELRGTVEDQEVLLASGFFSIRDGAFVSPDLVERVADRPADPGQATLSRKLTVIPDDTSIQGSLCVGLDCTGSESFGFSTVRLKENNLRIEFQDTSSTASFPTRDWQIRANENQNGGADLFAIDDLGSRTAPFTILGGAPDSAVFVDAQGDVGFGTSVPVLHLHVLDGNTPGLRLEQDSSGAFSAQTWDVAGNESNFFVRDATHGAKIPFRIKPDAPSNSIYVDEMGDVGLGTNAPAARLHVVGDIAVSGTVDGRDVSVDGATLDAHVVDFSNPHQVTAAQAGAEPAGNLKAGILPAAAFSGNPGTATVTFASPYPTGTSYALVLTAFTSDAKKLTLANVLAKDETGFTVTLGSQVKDLVEVDWIARVVGE